MLDLLMKYAMDHGLEHGPGFKPKEIRWAIVCGAGGSFIEVVELGDVGTPRNRGRTFPKCPDLSQGEMIGGGITKSHFLADTADVVALYDPKADEPGLRAEAQKVSDKHRYFVELLRDAARIMPDLELAAQCLSDEAMTEQIRNRLKAHNVKPADKVTLRIGHTFPLDSDRWHDWWREFRKGLSVVGSGNRAETGKKRKAMVLQMRCLATGELREPTPTHPKIEGLADVGGLATGDVLMGFDKDAFCSYGLAQSANAPVSEDAAAAYRAALNDLIKKHGEKLGGVKVIHWFRQKVDRDDDPLPWLLEPPETTELQAQERAKELLQSIQIGKWPDLFDNHYYALTLSGASGRVMVRDWMEGRFEELARNICNWFDDLSIIRRDGSALAAAPKFLAVLGSTVRELGDLPPPFGAQLWRVAVHGEAVPQFALARAVMRTKVGIIRDDPFNHARMGLMKAYHVRKNRHTGGNQMEENLRPYLNENHPSQAYHCGRLLAVLANVQRTALGDVGAGVVQRYYAAASSTPALVLGRITRLSQFHLNKLDTPKLAHWFETIISGIWAQLKDGPPRTLDLEEQSLFALGYYQQIASMRTKKSDKAVEEQGEKDE